MPPSFSKGYVFKAFFVHRKTNNRRFWIPVVWTAFSKAPFSWWIGVNGRPNRKNKTAFFWRISVDGRPNRRKKSWAAFSWRISVDGRPNRRNKAAFSWRLISVDGRPNRRNKAAFSWRISVDGRRNRRNNAAFLNFYSVVWTLPDIDMPQVSLQAPQAQNRWCTRQLVYIENCMGESPIVKRIL